jgi:hypothetical protein
MPDLKNCPICANLVFSHEKKFYCNNCSSIFSIIPRNGIIVNSVGKIDKRDIGNVLRLMLQNIRLTKYEKTS